MKSMLRRVLMLLATMLIVSFLTYAAFELISGDPAEAMLGTQATPARVEALRKELGLDAPFLVRYARWLLGFFSGNLGVSFSYKLPVAELIAPKLAVTLWMCLISFIIISVISLPLGVLSYQSAVGRFGWLHTTLNQFFMAVPPFFTGILISWGCGVILRFFTPGDFPDLHDDPAGALRYLFFAAVCIAIPRVAMMLRMMRSTVISEMEKDYVQTAISRGNDRQGVLVGHVLKNSLVPAITMLGQTMAEIVAGGIVVEQVFGIPGLGRLLVASIANRDYPTVQAVVVILAFWVVFAGMAADLVNQCIDPRLRLGGES